MPKRRIAECIIAHTLHIRRAYIAHFGIYIVTLSTWWWVWDASALCSATDVVIKWECVKLFWINCTDKFRCVWMERKRMEVGWLQMWSELHWTETERIGGRVRFIVCTSNKYNGSLYKWISTRRKMKIVYGIWQRRRTKYSTNVELLCRYGNRSPLARSIVEKELGRQRERRLYYGKYLFCVRSHYEWII